MTEFNGVDWLLADNEQGPIIHENSDEALNQLSEWLNTPEGEVYGNPAWGNPLKKFKHEDLENEDIMILLENAVIRKAMLDMPHLRISNIRTSLVDIDNYYLQILTPWGEVEKKL